MNDNTLPPRLDIRHAAQTDTQLAGQTSLRHMERLSLESRGLGLDNPVRWSVHLTQHVDQAGQLSRALHLTVDTALAQICQRCLEPVEVPVGIDRRFRFVDSEADAEAQDDQSEEDLLVISREFDLSALIEDEVLMDLPLIACHEVCPVPVKMAVVDSGFDQLSEKPNPFAQLALLKRKGSE